MQFINKQTEAPAEWDVWFKVPPDRRSFDYKADYRSLPQLRFAKKYLIEEQNALCAYCQQKIDIESASIEHFIPKEHNKALSTSYFNLIAVCNKNQEREPETGKFHCDRNRGSKLLPPIIFYAKSKSVVDRSNPFFTAFADGTVSAKPNSEVDIKIQVDAFLNILNLNHSRLKEKRAKDVLSGITRAYYSLPRESHQKNVFWRVQYDRILNNPTHPFREYLLVYIGQKIGMN